MSKRFLCRVGVLAAVAVLPSSGAEFKFGPHTLMVPEGFEVELAAPARLVPRPITADFDEEGRLYVSDSAGSNDKVEKQLAEKPHRILRLEDTDGDGRFDRSTVFADRMMFPEGTMWLRGSLYVAAPPSIWKLTDTDGDGVADRREEWFQGRTLTGCANDLHGPYRGIDGRIYWCKGAFAQQSYERPGGKPFVTRAAHIFRARPDGTGVEPVMTGGMDNPVDVVFTPAGERIFTTTFLQHPGGGRRDGLIHAIHGGLYGKVHDVLEGHPRTGPDVMPVLTHLGPAAPSGLTCYEASTFGEEFRDNLFACQFNLHKVSRHVLERDGATFRTRDSDFLVSDQTDFHPTDVIEDADGSLLVVDTGGWYKLCCPTSQLHKPDVLGGIYRVRRKGGARMDDPRGLKLPWNGMKPEAMARLLDDSRPAVRHRAVAGLASREGEASAALLEVLQRGASAEARRNAVWACTRMSAVEARAAVRLALGDADESVVLAALHSIAVEPDAAAALEIRRLLDSPSLHIRRSAATTLGRLRHPTAVLWILPRAANVSDRALEHSLIYALIDIGDAGMIRTAARTLGGLSRAALIALDQIGGGNLQPGEVTPLFASGDARTRETAAWIVSRHREWGVALVDYFKDRLGGSLTNEADRTELAKLIGPFAREAAVQSLLVETLRGEGRGPQLVALQAMAQGGLKEAPTDWTRELTRVMSGADLELRRAALVAARALPLGKNQPEVLTRALLALAEDSAMPPGFRLDALAAMPPGLDWIRPEVFQFLLDQLSPVQPVVTRLAAAGALGRARLSNGQLTQLAASVRTAGPLELTKLLGAFEKSTNENVGLSLVAALKEAKARPALRPETLRPRLTNFSARVQEAAGPLLTSLNLDAPQQEAQLNALLPELKGGDVRRGQAIFNGAKAACSACHAIGYLGGDLGPDLTRIGQIRTERDLLEAILYPSASFVRSYEPMVVATKAGDEFSGVVRADAEDEVVLGTGPGAEVRVARADIVAMRPGQLSVMPPGLDTQLSRAEMSDLLAFLKATR